MESRKSVGVSGLGLALLLGAQGAMAQVALQPQAIPFGSFVLVPTLVSQTIYDDNIYNLSNGEVASFSQVLNPTLAFVAQDRLNFYTAKYALKAASYANDSNDSYADQNFGLDAHIESGSRLRLDGGLSYSMLHDPRGSGSSAGVSSAGIRTMGEGDKYDLANLTAAAEYGARDARGLATAKVTLGQKRYSRDGVALSGDNDIVSSLLGLRARVMPKTLVLLDYERVDTNYKTNFDSVKGVGTPDALDNRFLVGVTWDGTAQTTGKIRLGQGKREVDGLGSKDRFTWDLGVVWKPRALDTVNLNGGASIVDATGDYLAAENTHYSVSWTHDWADRFNTVLTLGLSNDDYSVKPGTLAKARSDDGKTYGIGANYQMRRWLVLTADILASDRSSDVSAFDTKRNVMSIGAQISL